MTVATRLGRPLCGGNVRWPSHARLAGAGRAFLRRYRFRRWASLCGELRTSGVGKLHSGSVKCLRRDLPFRYRDQAHPRQSFGACVQGNQEVACHTARGPLQLCVHAKAWLVAQPRRGFLFKDGALRLAPHTGGIERRTKATDHGVPGRPQSRAQLREVTVAVVEAAREAPVIGTA